MSSFSTASNLLVTGFLIAICAAATPFSFDLPTTARQGTVSCTTNADCTATGCVCVGTSSKVCINGLKGAAELEACTKCASSADCPGDAKGCDSDVNRCGTCVLKAVITGAQACQATTPDSTGSTGTSGGSSGLAKCTAAGTCTGTGCSCLGETSLCFNRDVVVPAWRLCKKCTTAADCTGDTRGCEKTAKLCKTCFLQGLHKGNKACLPGATPSTDTTITTMPSDTNTTPPEDTTTTPVDTTTTPVDTTTTPVGTTTTPVDTTNSTESEPAVGSLSGIVTGSCNSTTSCGNGCTCSAELGNVCVSEQIFKEKIAECKSCDNNDQCPGSTCDVSLRKCVGCGTEAATEAVKSCTNQKPCIATSWLVERGLEHAAIRHAGVADVLCIPGNTALPCGTPGHLLRECAGESGECKLVTYREVCQRRGDCIKSTAPVSQLSHVHNWSPYRMFSEESEFELTSMSAHPLSGPWSPSRLVANGGDYLNRMGLGWICNAVALFKIDSYSVLKNAMFTES